MDRGSAYDDVAVTGCQCVFLCREIMSIHKRIRVNNNNEQDCHGADHGRWTARNSPAIGLDTDSAVQCNLARGTDFRVNSVLHTTDTATYYVLLQPVWGLAAQAHETPILLFALVLLVLLFIADGGSVFV